MTPLNRLRPAVMIAYNGAFCAAVGALAYRWYGLAPREMHAGVFAASAALSAVLSAISLQVFGKYDKILQDAEKYDVLRVERIYAYVHASRRRLLLFLVAAVVFLIVNTGLAVVLPKGDVVTEIAAHRAVSIGYFGVAGVLLFALRITHAYLRVDGFRLELFRSIQVEDERQQAILELRPSSVKQFESSNEAPQVSAVQPRVASR